MKKNASVLLVLALSAALSLGTTGCGGSDDSSSDTTGSVTDHSSDGGSSESGGGSGNGGSTTEGGVIYGSLGDVNDYANITIFKNVSDSYIKDRQDYYEFIKDDAVMELVDATTGCKDYGFSNPSDHGSFLFYTNADYTRSCAEYDYSTSGSDAGSKNVVIYVKQ